MAHYAKIGLNSKVISVLVVDNENIIDENDNETEQLGIDNLIDVTGYPFWIQTSYNNSFRKNYAGVGYRYDEDMDAFIPPKPYSSWTLNKDTCNWESPTPYPGDDGSMYMWDEEIQDWSILEEIK